MSTFRPPRCDPRCPSRVTAVVSAIAFGAAIGTLACGCSCESSIASVDAASSDAGPLFGGIDAPGYEVADTGPRPPEPCAVPIRRVRFPLGDESLTHANYLWVVGSRAWVQLGGYVGFPGVIPGSLHVFDLDAERELETDLVVAEGDAIVAVFESPGGYEVVMRRDGEPPRIVHVDSDARLTGAGEETLDLENPPLVRLNDGRYVSMALPSGATTPEPAVLEIATPSGAVERVELGFETASGHLTALDRAGRTIVGIGYEDEGRRAVRFEVDLDSSAVRLASLAEGVRLSGLLGSRLALRTSGAAVTAALSYEAADAAEPSPQTVEVFWWELGEDAVTRHIVRPPSDLRAGILALGGMMPLQTLALAQTSGFRTWVTAARVRAPGELVGGSEPLGVFDAVMEATAWIPSEGTTGIALLAQHELELLYVCEGAP